MVMLRYTHILTPRRGVMMWIYGDSIGYVYSPQTARLLPTVLYPMLVRHTVNERFAESFQPTRRVPQPTHVVVLQRLALGVQRRRHVLCRKEDLILPLLDGTRQFLVARVHQRGTLVFRFGTLMPVAG